MHARKERRSAGPKDRSAELRIIDLRKQGLSLREIAHREERSASGVLQILRRATMSGGPAYYLVSDLYIALFSRFTTCGSWEGHHILDFIHENTSDIQPETIHADTQGQSAAIYGLAHLLGIQLHPRIRNW